MKFQNSGGSEQTMVKRGLNGLLTIAVVTTTVFIQATILTAQKTKVMPVFITATLLDRKNSSPIVHY